MLMAVLAIEWSLLVHGFLHLHYDICHVDNFSTSDQYSLNQNISSLYHLEESYDQGSDHLENLNNKDIIDEHQLGMEEHLNDTQRQNINCNPSWPWININLHRWKIMMVKSMWVIMMLTIMRIWQMRMTSMMRMMSMMGIIYLMMTMMILV